MVLMSLNPLALRLAQVRCTCSTQGLKLHRAPSGASSSHAHADAHADIDRSIYAAAQTLASIVNDPRMAQPLLEELEAAGLEPVGDNEPYDGALKGDTLYDLASARGLAHVLIEIRQDLIAEPAGQMEWAGKIADALAPVLARQDIHKIEHYGSRAGARSQRNHLRRRT